MPRRLRTTMAEVPILDFNRHSPTLLGEKNKILQAELGSGPPAL
jgi:hypothetical protein